MTWTRLQWGSDYQTFDFWRQLPVSPSLVRIVGHCFRITRVYIQINITYSPLKSSRGGLVVELWTNNSLPSATVGSNLHQVWCINRSVEETLCYNSNCRTPGLRVYKVPKTNPDSQPRSEPVLELHCRAASSVGVMSPFQRSQNRKQFKKDTTILASVLSKDRRIVFGEWVQMQ